MQIPFKTTIWHLARAFKTTCIKTNRVFSITCPASKQIKILLEQKKAFALEKSSTPTGLVWDTDMPAVSLFRGTNMAAVTSCEKTLYYGTCA